MEQTISSLDLTASTYQKFKAAGYFHVCDVTDDVISRICPGEEWARARRVPETRTALDLLEKDTIAATIYTFNPCLDKILEGEFAAGNILELCGEAGSGKTQICFQLCVNVQLPEQYGGKAGEAVYICSNYNFSSSRLKEIASSTVNKISLIPQADRKLESLSVDNLLNGIHHFKIVTCEELLASVIHLKKKLRDSSRVRLVVIDSISAILDQVDYKSRQYFVYRLFSKLQALGGEYNFSIVVINNMTTRLRSNKEVYVTASFGDSFFHRVNTRIHLKRKSANNFEATVLKSVCKPELTKCFQL